MKRRILASVAAVALGAAAFVGGTGANFTGHANGPTNQVQAGTLGIQLIGDSSDPTYLPFSVTNAKPGDTSAVKMVEVQNTGTLSGNVKVRVVRDSAPNALSSEILLSIDGIGAMINKTLNDLDTMGATADGYAPLTGTPSAGDHRWYSVSWTIPSSAGNEIQGQTVQFHLEFDIEQA